MKKFTIGILIFSLLNIDCNTQATAKNQQQQLCDLVKGEGSFWNAMAYTLGLNRTESVIGLIKQGAHPTGLCDVPVLECRAAHAKNEASNTPLVAAVSAFDVPMVQALATGIKKSDAQAKEIIRLLLVNHFQIYLGSGYLLSMIKNDYKRAEKAQIAEALITALGNSKEICTLLKDAQDSVIALEGDKYKCDNLKATLEHLRKVASCI